MTANELRIGNYVNGGTVYLNQMVVGITPSEIITINGKHYDIEDDLIQPIPLTPEILEKAGLKCDWWGHNGDKPVGSYYIGETISISDEMLVWVGQEDNYPNIKYLHQLQNLVHILTGTELEINLT